MGKSVDNKLVLLCFVGHILGDYYFQTSKMAQEKAKNRKDLILHGILYGVPYLLLCLVMANVQTLALIFGLLILIHFMVDSIKFAWIKYRKYKECPMYFLDQGIHLFTILFVCFIIKNPLLTPAPYLKDFLDFCKVTTNWYSLQWIAVVLLINKPINVTFSKLFSSFKPTVKGDSTKKAGAVVGFLERILIVIFLSLNQFSAIGLILTAKSIARYDMIVKNQEFAEYYLIGTLTSVLSSVLSYYLVFYYL